VTKEKNEEALAGLKVIEGASETATSIFAPQGALFAPLAFKTAGLLLQNRQNKTLLDYQVQFYPSSAQIAINSGNVLYLAKGAFIFLGRPQHANGDFWNSNLRIERTSGRIVDEAGAELAVPYGRLTVATYDFAVPTVVQERSKLLIDRLGSLSSVQMEDIESSLKQLKSSVIVYKAHSELLNTRSLQSVHGIIDILQRSDENSLTGSDKQFLLNLMYRVTDIRFDRAQDAVKWWLEKGKDGIMDADSLKWTAAKPTSTGTL
jgi:hypothetical protein